MTYLADVHNHWLAAQRAIVVFLLTFVAMIGTSSATIVDFDDPSLSLGTNSYWNNSDGSGGFNSQGVHFPCNYNPSTYMGGGWFYSNVNNTTTSGPDNQYAAYAGTGVGGSGNYAVGYVDLYGGALPSIAIPNGMKVESAMFTTTTYAALSMLNGDFVAKKFGGASGTDPDWYRLTITGKNAGGGTTGTVDFYLADYRNINSKPDYIIQDWTRVDLTALGNNVSSLVFTMDSSDHYFYAGTDYGMSTPSYFAMDNLTLVPEPSTCILLISGSLTALAWRWRRRKG